MRRRRHHYRRSNPVGAGLDTNTILMLGMGTALLGAIVYAIYQLGQAQNTLAATNDVISGASSSAQSVSDQIAAAAQSAQNVSDQIYNANQTVQSIQQSAAYQAANQAAGYTQ
jgi:hypothetical protein